MEAIIMIKLGYVIRDKERNRRKRNRMHIDLMMDEGVQCFGDTHSEVNTIIHVPQSTLSPLLHQKVKGYENIVVSTFASPTLD